MDGLASWDHTIGGVVLTWDTRAYVHILMILLNFDTIKRIERKS